MSGDDRGLRPADDLVAHWFRDAAWDDESLEWDGFDDRVRTAWVDLGDPDDPSRPLVMFVRYAPGITVRPHAHASDRHLAARVGGPGHIPVRPGAFRLPA